MRSRVLWFGGLLASAPCTAQPAWWSGGMDEGVQSPGSVVQFDADGDGSLRPELYVAARLANDGAEPGQLIGRWDGAAWSPLGSVFSVDPQNIGNQGGPWVRKLLVADLDGPAGAPPVLIAAGRFDRIDGAPFRSVAAWNGSEWSALGGGLGWQYYSLTEGIRDVQTHDPDGPGPEAAWIVVCGRFDAPEGGVYPRCGVAAWYNGAWHGLAGITTDFPSYAAVDWIRSVRLPGAETPTLFAAGYFWIVSPTRAGQSARYFVRLNSDGVWENALGGAGGFKDLVEFDPDGPGPLERRLVTARESELFWYTGDAIASIARSEPADYRYPIRSLALHDFDGAGGEPARLIVLGAYMKLGSVLSPTSAWFDGEHLHPMGAGLGADSSVAAAFGALTLTADSGAAGGGGLLVYGKFDFALQTPQVGAIPANNLALFGEARPTGVEPDCAGDLNRDGLVDSVDLAMLLGAWGSDSPAFDFSDDGRISSPDLPMLLGSWGPCPR